ncbi:MAG: cytochrome d ubiquinol oxidase subunit II [Acidimicrobiales bacterium]|jgi:cytochrome d ubiquinol oxidase subunit II
MPVGALLAQTGASIPAPTGNLQIFWFLLIGILWIGYFFLEGFDFGVGILLPFLGHDDLDRRVLINTIGPVWDGNEVWLLVAGGATFAAFPRWYAILFSGFYLPLLLILLALIVRGVAFEFRGKNQLPLWRATWDRVIFWGSLLPALLWGVAFADFVGGVPLGRGGHFVAGFWHLLTPYALLGGVTFLALVILHGATFLSLRTDGEMAERTRRAARRIAPVTLAAVVAFLSWTFVNATHAHDKGIVPGFVPILAIVVVGAAGWLVSEKLDGWAFIATGVGFVLVVSTLLLNLYPRVLVSSVAPRFDLTIANTASAHYTLVVMTIVAAIFTPFVLIYQGWSYWVFRQRVRRPGSPPTTASPGPA